MTPLAGRRAVAAAEAAGEEGGIIVADLERDVGNGATVTGRQHGGRTFQPLGHDESGGRLADMAEKAFLHRALGQVKRGADQAGVKVGVIQMG